MTRMGPETGSPVSAPPIVFTQALHKNRAFNLLHLAVYRRFMVYLYSQQIKGRPGNGLDHC